MKIETLSNENQTLKVSLTGRLDLQGQQVFETELNKLMANDTKNVILDLSGMDFLASIGMRSFVSLAKQLHAGNGDLTLCNLQELVKESLVTTGLDQILNITDNC